MNVLDLIDTRQGSSNQREFSHGNTLPYAAVPFGMNAFVPQSRINDVRFFNANDFMNYGFRLTHQPSPWMGDYAFVIMNFLSLTKSELNILQNSSDHDMVERFNKSSYNPNYSAFKPNYLSVFRLKDNVNISLIPTVRGASLKVKKKSENQLFFTLSIASTGELNVSRDGRELYGFTDQLSGSKNNNFKMYFKFKSKKCTFNKVTQTKYYEDEHLMKMYWFEVYTSSDEDGVHEFDITTSFISLNQAEINFKQDNFYLLNWNKKKSQVGMKWLNYLEKIKVKHKDMDLIKTFYNCLYRTAVFPQIAYEINGKGQIIHYSPYTSVVEEGYYYLNNGYWDTFRTNYPLYSIIMPDLIQNFMEGILNIYKEDGYLPKWLSPDERGLMPGTLVDAVIADAVVKNLVDEDTARQLLKAMIFTATNPSSHPLEGREQSEFYFENGYVNSDTPESVNKTLDYSYSDFCIAQVAQKLGEEAIANKFYHYSFSYRNLFDNSSSVMKPIDKHGQKVKNISSHRWGQHYTEGSAWQNSFSVFHNIADLIRLHGGDDLFCQHLIKLINMRPVFDVGGYGEEIHEMSEMAVLQFGQLAISNQPSFHIPHMFTYAGRPNFSQILLKQLMMNCFNSSFEGFPGDEDNGSMSAWFVLNSLGIYSVTPGTEEYVLGICIWDEAAIYLSNGKSIEISSTPQEPYLNVVTKRFLNDKLYTKDYVSYNEIMKGISLNQELGVVPQVNITDEKNRPYSLNTSKNIKWRY